MAFADQHFPQMPTSPTRKYKVVSLFSGAMGLDLGLEHTGRFEIVACVELEKSYCDTIKLNQAKGRLSPDMVVYNASVADVDPNELLRRVGLKVGQVDLLAGGPPCQSFSTAGRRRTVQDPRGTLLWEYLRWIEALQPRFFLMENVRGLLSAALQHRAIAERPDKGGLSLAPEEQHGSVVRAFAEDLQRLEGGGYHMDCFEVNAVNYGAPQLRERALFIGNRYNAVVDVPQPTHGVLSKAGHRQDDLFVAANDLLPWKTLGEAIADVSDPDPVVLDFSPRKKEILKLVPPGSNWRSLPVEVQQESMGAAWHAKGGRSGWWRRLTYDLPSPTLVTMPNHASTALCHPTETRALSIKEYARIQEFPDQWEFCGTTSKKYAQVGNAVPVRLGTVAGTVLAEALDKLAGRRWKPYKEVPESYRVIYLQSHVRTRQWFKDGKVVVWNDGQDSEHAAYGESKTKVRVSKIAA